MAGNMLRCYYYDQEWIYPALVTGFPGKKIKTFMKNFSINHLFFFLSMFPYFFPLSNRARLEVVGSPVSGSGSATRTESVVWTSKAFLLSLAARSRLPYHGYHHTGLYLKRFYFRLLDLLPVGRSETVFFWMHVLLGRLGSRCFPVSLPIRRRIGDRGEQSAPEAFTELENTLAIIFLTLCFLSIKIGITRLTRNSEWNNVCIMLRLSVPCGTELEYEELWIEN